jgi:hypothetical protein
MQGIARSAQWPRRKCQLVPTARISLDRARLPIAVTRWTRAARFSGVGICRRAAVKTAPCDAIVILRTVHFRTCQTSQIWRTTTADMLRSIFTIGHSNHSIEKLLDLLAQHWVTAIADVRSAPYSRLYPVFNREPLAAALRDRGMAYVFLGKELGARSDDASCYERGVIQYRRLAQTALFRGGIQRVLNGAASNQLSLLCAEKEPLDCHRTILVSRELEAAGAHVSHILADGRLEPHTETLRRLLAAFKLQETELFRGPDEILDDAYARQESRIAYVAPDASQDAQEAD